MARTSVVVTWGWGLAQSAAASSQPVSVINFRKCRCVATTSEVSTDCAHPATVIINDAARMSNRSRGFVRGALHGKAAPAIDEFFIGWISKGHARGVPI